MNAVAPRNPRAGCIELVGQRYELTDIGVAQILELASLGSSIREIADYLRVSDAWLRKELDDEGGCPRAIRAWSEGIGEYKKRIRVAQMAIAEAGNAHMAIHLGKTVLGQKELPQEVNVTKTIHVVGAMPNYQQTPADWQKQFAPDTSAPQLPKPDVEEAEVVDDPA